MGTNGFINFGPYRLSLCSLKTIKDGSIPLWVTLNIKITNMLRRSQNRFIAGVCGGVANWLSIDPIIMRVIAAIAILVYGVGFWLYILLWILIPSE